MTVDAIYNDWPDAAFAYATTGGKLVRVYGIGFRQGIYSLYLAGAETGLPVAWSTPLVRVRAGKERTAESEGGF